MPRGGWRQRAGERSRSPPGPTPFFSEQLKTWMASWAWGQSSAAEVLRNAVAFVRDGHRDVLIEQLARSGGDEKNADRALCAAFVASG